MKTSFTQILVASVLFLFTFCGIADAQRWSNEPPLSDNDQHIQQIANGIASNFASEFVGFQFTIAQNGNHKLTQSLGSASLLVDGQEYDYENYHRKSIQSCSKTLTAAALIHELNVHNLDPNTPIQPFLPAYWSTDHINVTFHDLLKHTSGFRGTHDLLSDMKTYIEAGSFASKSFDYENVNFSLMRLLIPNINPISRANHNKLFSDFGEVVYETGTASTYIKKCRNNILIPSGIDPRVSAFQWDVEIADKVYHYNYSDTSIPGYQHSDFRLKTGAGGWYMNSKEFAAFVSKMMADQFPFAPAAEMMGSRYGMYKDSDLGVDYYTHNGAFDSDNGRGARALWVYFPSSKILVTIMANSGTNGVSMNALEQGVVTAHKAVLP